MNPLQYTSEEMFSSTELIRKSKSVFDKLHNKNIEKAIILRDGKPAFMLLDFSVYEDIMSEYLSLKEMIENKVEKTTENKKVLVEENIPKINEKIHDIEELNEKDLEEALAEIDNLDLEKLSEETKKQIDDKEESLKEFWE